MVSRAARLNCTDSCTWPAPNLKKSKIKAVSQNTHNSKSTESGRRIRLTVTGNPVHYKHTRVKMTRSSTVA